MPAIHGLGLSASTLTVTYQVGAVDDVRVDLGTEAFTAAGSNEFRKSLLSVDAVSGAVTETAGADTADQTLASAVIPAIPAGEVLLAVVEIDDTNVTGFDTTVAGDVTAASS